MSVKIFIVTNIVYNGQPSKYRTVCRLLAIAALHVASVLCVGLVQLRDVLQCAVGG